MELKSKTERNQFLMIYRSSQSSCTEEFIIRQHEQYLELMDIAREIDGNGGFRAGSFFSVNRGTLASFVGIVALYLIILMTWPLPHYYELENRASTRMII